MHMCMYFFTFVHAYVYMKVLYMCIYISALCLKMCMYEWVFICFLQYINISHLRNTFTYLF